MAGEYGNVLGAHFKRVISQPNWTTAFGNMEKSGGPGVDLHIHDTHYILVFARSARSGGVFGQAGAGSVCGIYFHELSIRQPAGFVRDVCFGGDFLSRAGRLRTGLRFIWSGPTVLYEFSTLGGKPVVTMPVTLVDG